MTGFGKNVIPRRAHKERSQPASRVSKHGLLEKKKDYKLRAKDRNQKNLRVKILREKAAFRNPDEFYYGMIRSRTRDGRMLRNINKSEKNAIPIANLKREERMLAETQDSRYVTMKLQTETAAAKKLADKLHFLDKAGKTRRTHKIFKDDEDDSNTESPTNTVIQLQDKILRHTEEGEDDSRHAYEELERRSSRISRLRSVLNDMSKEKIALSKGRRSMVTPPNPQTGAPAVFCWRKERSK